MGINIKCGCGVLENLHALRILCVWGIGMNQCEDCAYYAYDEDYEDYFCEADMDEDDYARMMTGRYKSCPLYRNGDEYSVVRHQM